LILFSLGIVRSRRETQWLTDQRSRSDCQRLNSRHLLGWNRDGLHLKWAVFTPIGPEGLSASGTIFALIPLPALAAYLL
jgi:hypothetical protein